MKQLNIIILSLGVILFTSCKKEDVKPNTIKYEVETTHLSEIEIQYTNVFGNTNTELFTGNKWTKSIEIGTEEYYKVSVSQDNLPISINNTLKMRVYYNDVLVDEELTTTDTGYLFGYADYWIQ